MIEDLAEQLRADGLGLDQNIRRVVSCRILEHGEVEFGRLRETMGNRVERFRGSSIRAMGVGAALTEFMIAVAPVPLDCIEAVTRLGGLTCLIVSAFDGIIDSGAPAPAVFDAASTEGSEAAAIVQDLVREYFRQLDELPLRNKRAAALLDRAIHRMHAAEMASQARLAISRSTWWRKNVLPFAVMSLAAWQTIDERQWRDAGKHLRWVCRMGEFLGWIDDCADRDEDVSRGHANRLAGVTDAAVEKAWACRIAHQGGRVLAEWEAAGGAAWSRDIFATVVWSWIEGRSVERR